MWSENMFSGKHFYIKKTCSCIFAQVSAGRRFHTLVFQFPEFITQPQLCWHYVNCNIKIWPVDWQDFLQEYHHCSMQQKSEELIEFLSIIRLCKMGLICIYPHVHVYTYKGIQSLSISKQSLTVLFVKLRSLFQGLSSHTQSKLKSVELSYHHSVQ